MLRQVWIGFMTTFTTWSGTTPASGGSSAGSSSRPASVRLVTAVAVIEYLSIISCAEWCAEHVLLSKQQPWATTEFLFVPYSFWVCWMSALYHNKASIKLRFFAVELGVYVKYQTHLRTCKRDTACAPWGTASMFNIGSTVWSTVLVHVLYFGVAGCIFLQRDPVRAGDVLGLPLSVVGRVHRLAHGAVVNTRHARLRRLQAYHHTRPLAARKTCSKQYLNLYMCQQVVGGSFFLCRLVTAVDEMQS